MGLNHPSRPGSGNHPDLLLPAYVPVSITLASLEVSVSTNTKQVKRITPHPNRNTYPTNGKHRQFSLLSSPWTHHTSTNDFIGFINPPPLEIPDVIRTYPDTIRTWQTSIFPGKYAISPIIRPSHPANTTQQPHPQPNNQGLRLDKQNNKPTNRTANQPAPENTPPNHPGSLTPLRFRKSDKGATQNYRALGRGLEGQKGFEAKNPG